MSDIAVRLHGIRGRRSPWQFDRTNLARSIVMFFAFLVTFGGLHTILAGVQWWLYCSLLALVGIGSGLVVRAVLFAKPTLARIGSPLVSAVTLAVTILVTFAADTLVLGVIPTAQTVQRFHALLRDAGYSIVWQNVPADVDLPILCLLGIGVSGLLVLAEVFAFSLRLPALVGLVFAALFLIPGATPEGETDGLFFAGSAVAFLCLLLVGRMRAFVPGIAIAAVAVIGGLVLPTALPSTDVAVTTNTLGPSVSTGVNPMIRLGDDLRQSDTQVALTYSTVSGKPEYLRLVVISDFDGTNWAPSQPELDKSNRPVALPRPPGLDVGVSTAREVSYLHVANLQSPWLPVPYPAVSVTGLTGSWQYVPDSFTVASNQSLARGENYTATSVVLTPTPEQLLEAGTTVPAGMDEYLALPVDTPVTIETTAREVTGGVTSNYEKALALQGYLRSQPFQYSETAPVSEGYDGTGVDVVAKFLEARRGYCIHFASAMAVMARELGIPSRIVVGFQPGSITNTVENGRRIFEATTHDLHSWPELYFSGIGWVRFEPTPSRGAVPDYASENGVGVPVIPGSRTQNAGGAVGGRNGLTPEVDAGPTVARWLVGGQWSAWIVVAAVLVGIVALLLVPASLRSLRRRRRMSAIKTGRGSAASAWWELLESAEDVGIATSRTQTLRETVAKLRRVRGMDDEGRGALTRLGSAVEAEGYGRPTTLSGGVVGDGASRDRGTAIVRDLKAILSCLRAGVDSAVNARAALLPPSLLARVMRMANRLN